MELTPEDFRPNVEKGARWLEEQGAWDWPDKILAAVAVSDFDLTSCNHCAAGTALADIEGVSLLDCWGEWERYGFSTEDDPDWETLEQAWITYAREEQAARA
jgi:hypothetical protein